MVCQKRYSGLRFNLVMNSCWRYIYKITPLFLSYDWHFFNCFIMQSASQTGSLYISVPFRSLPLCCDLCRPLVRTPTPPVFFCGHRKQKQDTKDIQITTIQWYPPTSSRCLRILFTSVYELYTNKDMNARLLSMREKHCPFVGYALASAIETGVRDNAGSLVADITWFSIRDTYLCIGMTKSIQRIVQDLLLALG